MSYTDIDEKDQKPARGITITTRLDGGVGMFKKEHIEELAKRFNITEEEVKTQIEMLYTRAYEEYASDKNKQEDMLKNLIADAEKSFAYSETLQDNEFISKKMGKGRNPWDKKHR